MNFSKIVSEKQFIILASKTFVNGPTLLSIKKIVPCDDAIRVKHGRNGESCILLPLLILHGIIKIPLVLIILVLLTLNDTCQTYL